MYPGVPEAIRRFFRPFYETRAGQILLLAAAQDNTRDALAAMEILRYFPYPDYANIRVEPSRKSIRPQKNVIIIGRFPAFRGQDTGNGHRKEIVTIDHPSLARKAERLLKGCALQFEGNGQARVLRNTLTRRKYPYQARDRNGHEIDYGVIRLAFGGVTDYNLIICEGNHQAGTMGLAKFATSPDQLQAVADAVAEIEDFNESLPLEIVVKADFNPKLSDGVYTMEAIDATPLMVVYNRNWAWNLRNGGLWVDQEPWNLSLEDWNGKPPQPDGCRFEMEADLRSLDARTREFCARVMEGRVQGQTEDRTRLLTMLTQMSDRFPMFFYEKGVGKKEYRLPQGGSRIRVMRKRFLAHMVISHFIDRPFHCTDDEIVRFFPGFREKWVRKGDTIQGKFVQTVKGRMAEGFGPLLGKKGRERRAHLEIKLDRGTRECNLDLLTAGVVLKLRF